MSTKGIAVVTGGAGFIGRHLVVALMNHGYAVRVLDPAVEAGMFPKPVKISEGSILNPENLDDILKGADVLIHGAALTHLWAKNKKDFEAINVDGTAEVLRAAERAGIKKIVATSTETILRGWRDNNPFPITEEDPKPPLEEMAGPYTRSKWQAAELVRDAAKKGLPVCQVYPTVPVGPGDYGLTAPSKMILDFVRGKTPAFYNALLNFVAVEDVAEGHVLTLEHGMPGEEFILGSENLTMATFLEMLGDVADKKMPTRTVPYELAAATAMTTEFISNFITRKPPVASKEAVKLALNPAFVTTHHAEKRLGYAPGSVKSALKRTLKWFKEVELI